MYPQDPHFEMRITAFASGCLLFSPCAAAQYLMVAEDENDRVMLFDAFDGTLIDPAYIDLASAVPTAIRPIEAVRTGDEIWITDQTTDSVYRYSIDGSVFLGELGGACDNVRGLAVANGSVYVTNAFAGGGAPGEALKEYALDGSLQNSFATLNPFDVIEVAGELYVSNIVTNDIDRYSYAGASLGPFHLSLAGGLNFPQQISLRANGNVYAAGFLPPVGIYEFDSAGVQVNFYPTSLGLHGVHEIGNGNVLYTDLAGTHIMELPAQTSTTVAAVVSRFIAPLETLSLGTSFCSSSVNSSGFESLIRGGGTRSVAANDLSLFAGPMAPAEPGIFYYGPNEIQVAFGNGFRCIGGGVGQIFRLFPFAVASPNGELAYTLDLTSPPPGGQVVAGSTWKFQAWFRDPAGGGAGFNLSDGLSLSFTP
jgi:hypothetical protein